MSDFHRKTLAQRFQELSMSRREMLNRCGVGMGALALAALMNDVGLTAPAEAAVIKPGQQPHAEPAGPLAPKQPQFPAKAKRVIHLFANGGPSHVDTFDPKPLLDRLHGKPLPMPNLSTE